MKTDLRIISPEVVYLKPGRVKSRKGRWPMIEGQAEEERTVKKGKLRLNTPRGERPW